MAAAHRALAADLGVDDLCSFPGFVDESTLENLTRGASVLVNPSVREGYGLVIVEAAAVGVPSVAVEAPDNAAAELIHDGVNGFTAVGPEPTAVADAIARVLDAGAPLRRTTFDWYATEARAGTVEATARQLLEVLL
jgi:glycosyltransferase involved in cell wall biosynthesis